MDVTEIFQRCGDFRLELDSPPAWIIDQLTQALGRTGDPDQWDPRDGAIVVTHGRVPKSAMSLSASIYTGILTKRTGRFSFSGRSNELFLGTAGVPGPYRIIKPSNRENQTLTDVATDLLPAPYTANVTEPGGTIDYTWPAATTYAEMLDYCLDLFADCAWKVNPDFTVDLGPNSSVVRTVPNVVVGELPIGDFGVGVRSVRGTFNESIDAEGVTNAATGFGRDYGGGTFESVTVFSGRPTTRDPVNGAEQPTTRLADMPQSSFTDEIRDGAQALLNLWERPRDEPSVVCPASSNAYLFIGRGDRIMLYDPVGGAEQKLNHRRIRGLDVFPIEATVTEMSYSFAETSGVWLLRHNGIGQTFLELTPWVRFSNGDTTLNVSTGKGALDTSTGKAARFEQSLADRLTAPTNWQTLTIVSLTQGTATLTYTTNVARFAIIGAEAVFQIDLTVTSTGQNNREILLELDPTEWGATELTGGSNFRYWDQSSDTSYVGTTIPETTTSIKFQTSGNTNGIGRTPNFPAGNGDVLRVDASEPLD